MVEQQGRAASALSLRGLFFSVCLLAVFACASFAGAASWVLWLRFVTAGHDEGPGFLGRLITKALFFSLVAVGSAWWLARKTKKSAAPGPPGSKPEAVTAYSAGMLALAMTATAALVFPKLDAYPWTAPDELHHLIVARNLAEHHDYASGHPDTGLQRFDTYDSVGVTVIGPVAAAFKVAGTGIVQARMIIACSFMMLCALVYGLLRPLFGPAHGAWGVLMLVSSFGSVYLARSLYGEVPAFLFFVAGLIFWRRAIAADKGNGPALVSGLFFGLAVLTKTFLLVSVWAFVGALLYDRLTYRRLRWRQTLLMGLGAALPLGLWWIVQAFYSDPAAEKFSLLIYYRHSLLFGLRSADVGLGWLLRQPVTLVVAAAAMLAAVPVVFREKYDPPGIVLLLTGVLFAFWWVFFTTGSIPRYMWYTCAVAGIFSGVLLESGHRYLVDKGGRPLLRAAALLGMACIAVTSLARAQDSAKEVYGHDEQGDDLALGALVGSLPGDLSIATTYWPLERSLNFFAGRPVTVVGSLGEGLEAFDLVVMDAQTESIPKRVLEASRRVGRYVMVSDRE